MSGFDEKQLNTDEAAAVILDFDAEDKRSAIANRLRERLEGYQVDPAFQQTLDDHGWTADIGRLTLAIMWAAVSSDPRAQKLTASDLRALADAGKPSPNEVVFRHAAKIGAAEFDTGGKPDELEEVLLEYLKEYATTFAYMADEEPERQRLPWFRMDGDYIQVLNSELTNLVFYLSFDMFKCDELGKIATYEKEDAKIEVHEYETLKNITTSKLMLLDAVFMALTANNYNHSKGTTTTVTIPLAEFAEMRGRNITARECANPEDQRKEKERAKRRRLKFKNEIRDDLDGLDKVVITGVIKKGPAAGNYTNLPLILSNHKIRGSAGNEYIEVSLDKTLVAMLLRNNFIFQFAPRLFSVNGSNPNVYRLGRYMLLHSSMRSNQGSGTDCTLSVKSLIAAAPNIPHRDELTGSHYYEWDERIRKPLETVLKTLTDDKVIARWEYREPQTGKTYTPKTLVKARPEWEFFENLRVDYTLFSEITTTN